MIAQLHAKAINVSLNSEACTESPRLKIRRKKDTKSFISAAVEHCIPLCYYAYM